MCFGKEDLFKKSLVFITIIILIILIFILKIETVLLFWFPLYEM